MINRHCSFPAIIIALTVCLSMGFILSFQILRQQTLYFVCKLFWLGQDYYDFYQASLNILQGKSPYLIERYVTPPLPALLNIPLTILPYNYATIPVVILIPIAILAAFLLINKIVNSQNTISDNVPIIISGIVTIFFSYPFLFLLDRGNTDGYVVLLMCMVLCCLRKNKILAGVLLAIAISVKVYPVLLFIPLMINRRWKVLLSTCVTVVIFMLLTPDLWRQYLSERFFFRTGQFEILYNSSLAYTFFYMGSLTEKLFALTGRTVQLSLHFKNISFLAYGFLLLCMGLSDLKRCRHTRDADIIPDAVMYFPFMIALPQLAYNYELIILVILIPVLCYLWQAAEQKILQAIIMLIACGVAITQTQAVALAKLSGTNIPYFILGLGLLLAMVGCTAYKFYTAYGMGRLEQHPATGKREPGGLMVIT